MRAVFDLADRPNVEFQALAFVSNISS